MYEYCSGARSLHYYYCEVREKVSGAFSAHIIMQCDNCSRLYFFERSRRLNARRINVHFMDDDVPWGANESDSKFTAWRARIGCIQLRIFNDFIRGETHADPARV